ncbi:MAG: thiol peroxidase, partial [Desulfobacterales bacterium]
MFKTAYFHIAGVITALLLAACATPRGLMIVDAESVLPGTQVAKKGQPLPLLGAGIQIGQRLPETELVDMETQRSINLNDSRGRVLVLSIVPSIDTQVCEAQTHYLGEEGDALPATIQRITISRDTPFAQARFAQQAELEDIHYLSDYKEGAFGRATGLLMDGPRLLARSVIVVDKQGIVRYIQVVPDITHLPDMEKAFATAIELDNL